jgi:flagellar biosynthesis chaperone FliJ
VADAIRASGGNPSTRSVRERLGNTGSMSTITSLMQRWRDDNRQADVELALPTGLQRGLLAFVAEERAAARAALEADMVNLQQEVADLVAENDCLEAARRELADALAEREALVSALQTRLAHLEGEVDAARKAEQEARTGAEQTRVELAKAALRLEGLPQLQEMLERAQAEARDERERRIAAEQRAAVLEARLEAAAPAANGLSLHNTLRTGERRNRQ